MTVLFVTVESSRRLQTMTALPADILGEIICYVDNLGTFNAIARSCKAGAKFVSESADYIADALAECRPPDYHPKLPNGLKHGDVVMPGFDSDEFTVTYCRGVVASWLLYTGDHTIIRGHRDTHYALISSSNSTRCSHYIGVNTDDGAYHQFHIDGYHHGQRKRLEGYIVDDVIVPDVIERWAVATMGITRPTRPYILYCDTREHAGALNELGIVDARNYA